MTVHPARARTIVRGLTLLFVGAAVASTACGGAEPAPAKAPAYEGREKTADEAAPEPRTIEEAQNQIAHARAMLEAGGETKATSESAAPRAVPPTSPQGGAAPPARQEREDACGSPCRALASMKRAVEALCRMTGDTDDRCADAKRTLGESTSRIASCKCELR